MYMIIYPAFLSWHTALWVLKNVFPWKVTLPWKTYEYIWSCNLHFIQPCGCCNIFTVCMCMCLHFIAILHHILSMIGIITLKKLTSIWSCALHLFHGTWPCGCCNRCLYSACSYTLYLCYTWPCGCCNVFTHTLSLCMHVNCHFTSFLFHAS